MSGTGLVNAFASLVASHHAVHEFYRDPEALQNAYQLSDAELRTLQAIPMTRLHLSHEIVRSKRIGTLQVLLPQTVGVLIEFDDYRTLNSYLDDVLARSDVDLTRGVSQTGDLVGWLIRRSPAELPPGLLDLARFEFTMLELGADNAAAVTAKERAESAPPPPIPLRGEAYPALTPDVRVELFDIDVLALPPSVSLDALATTRYRPGGVLLRKVWNTRQPACLRLGTAAARLARECDGRRSVGQVIAEVPEDLRARAVEVLQRLVDLAVVAVRPAPSAEQPTN